METLRNRKTKNKIKHNNGNFIEEKEETELISKSHEDGKDYMKLINQERFAKDEGTYNESKRLFRINFEVDFLSVTLFLCGILTRMYKLEQPKNIV
ncbi:hypothetical protein NQ314_013253 [Rhamnusium bicolor]|uniref:Uncharacterized protein n=1 Tax=Rhamnusium bicolor TaxID=1586634 RepID=A0AAV8X7Z6_9CUCU|nr:hypothetical protein NQ314_013253 [Rhamnusium bicolor]